MVLTIYRVIFVDNDHAPMKGCLDDDLEATVLLLEQKYPFNMCPDHPKKQCFNYRVTNTLTSHIHGYLCGLLQLYILFLHVALFLLTSNP